MFNAEHVVYNKARDIEVERSLYRVNPLADYYDQARVRSLLRPSKSVAVSSQVHR